MREEKDNVPASSKGKDEELHDKPDIEENLPKRSRITLEDDVITVTEKSLVKAKGPPKKFKKCSWKNYYLTYPANSTPKETVFERIKTHYGANLKWLVVAHELHEDGTDHLHACYALNKAATFTTHTHLDDFAGKHGNYQATREKHKVLTYCTKDRDFLATGISPLEYVNAVVAKKSTTNSKDKTNKEAIEAIRNGMDLKTLWNLYPSWTLRNQRLAAGAIQLEREYKASLVVPKTWRPITPTEGMAEHDLRIIAWLNENFKPGLRPRKTPQLYIYGPPNSGKTQLLDALRANYRGFDVVTEILWQDHYSDSSYDFGYLDEFVGGKAINWMNKWLEGAPQTIQVRGGTFLKKKNFPTIICSNLSPLEAYHNSKGAVLDAFLCRLELVEIPAGKRIECIDLIKFE